MTVVTDKTGDALLEFIESSEEDILNSPSYSPLTFSVIILKHEDKFLLVYNKFKKSWQLPGGKIREGATPRECIIRELREEANQVAEHIAFKGVVKVYQRYYNRYVYGAVFSGSLDSVRSFEESNEVERMTFWDSKSDIGYVDEIDRKLIESYWH